MKPVITSLLPLAALALAGCATPGYRCKMPSACDPVHDNYQAATHDTSWKGWRAGEAGSGKKTTGKKADAKPVTVKANLHTPESDATALPVYTPPQPWMVWLAPYSRADGTLESGTYVWFTTPGHWNYLGRQWAAPPFADAHQPGSSGSGDTLGPVSPTDLGFTPGKALAPTGVIKGMPQPAADGGSN